MIGKRWTRLALAVCFAAFASGAHAQVNPESCGEIRDPDTEFQKNLCTAHVGCSLVFKIQNVCAKAKGFLDKLRDTLTGRQEITNNDVFEAAAPEARPVPALTRYIDTAREAVRSTFNDPANRQKQEITVRNGTRTYYEGGLNNGVWEGAGVWINESGSMGRGKMNNNGMNGDGQTVSANGALLAGNFQNNRLQGPAAGQGTNGTVLTGNMINGAFTGYVTYHHPEGYTFINYYDPPGKVAVQGRVAPPGQKPVPPDVAVASVQPTAPAAPASAAPPAPAPAAAGGDCAALRPAAVEFVMKLGNSAQVANDRVRYTESIVVPNWSREELEYAAKEVNFPIMSATGTRNMSGVYTQCLARQRLAQMGAKPAGQAPVTGSQVAAAGNVSPGAGGTFSGTCKSAYDQQEAQFHEINRRAPQSNALIPPLQTALYMTSQRMALLNQLCKGQPQYAEYALMQRQHADAMRTCLQVASSSTYCNASPSRPGW